MSIYKRKYYYFIDGKERQNKLKLFPEKSSDELFSDFQALKEVLDAVKIDNINSPKNKDNSTNYIEFVWIDLAILNLSNNAIEGQVSNNLKEDSVFNILLPSLKSTSPAPRIYIGSQPLKKIMEDSESVNHKQLFQLDNNIWTYYINIQSKNEFENKLKKILFQIKYNFENNLYKLNISHEYLGFFRRQCAQNYLDGGHSSQVLPFVFTPKSLLNEYAINHFFNENLNLDEDWSRLIDTELKIKVLLVDDFANKPLRKVYDIKYDDSMVIDSINSIRKENATKGSKAELLLNLWHQVSNEVLAKKKINLKLDLSMLETPDAKLLKDEYFDIILLDYNFNEPKNGVDFLKDLKDIIDTNTEWIPGPFNKPWIIPTSSFSNAFIDEMRNNAISFMDSHHKMLRGADFINTPNLFLFYFTRTINEIVQIAMTAQKNIYKIDDLINVLNEKKDWEEIKNNQDIFKKDFQQHISNKKNIDFLLKAKEGILKNIIQNPNKYEKQINYYEQLLYNLAYRNYDGNEEIIIFYDLLKKSNQQ